MTYFIPQGPVAIHNGKGAQARAKKRRKVGLMIETDWSKPIKSLALAVRPAQVTKARAWAEAQGVPTDFTPGGEPIFRSRQHRRDYCKIRGVVDNNGGYGDATQVRSEIMARYKEEDERATTEALQTLAMMTGGGARARLTKEIMERLGGNHVQ